MMEKKFLVVDPMDRLDLIKALASELRLKILKLLERSGPLNVNQIAEKLGLHLLLLYQTYLLKQALELQTEN